MPKIHRFSRETTISTELEKAWDFISSPANLDAITPPDMTFEIMTEVPEKMYNGLLIEYRVGIPLVGKQTWLTELKHIRDGHSFVDEQRIGPYKFWYHYHEVSKVEGGVRFIDHVNYVMPFGPLGALVHQLYVSQQLRKTFDYRGKAMLEHLGRAG
ncbi:MAG: SRPBCC family protein [Verrucomicrobiota bacterium]